MTRNMTAEASEGDTITVLLDGIVPIRHTLRADGSTIEASASRQDLAAERYACLTMASYRMSDTIPLPGQ